MSEEILRALMQLFAIIAKQDEGVETKELKFVETFLTSQLSEEQVKVYMDDFIQKAKAEERKKKRAKEKAAKKAAKESGEKIPEKRISRDDGRVNVLDSVRVMGVCRKINKTLTHPQKVIALVRVFELVNADKKFSEQRMAIIDTVASAFNISNTEFTEIRDFVRSEDTKDLDNESILIADSTDFRGEFCKKIDTETLHGSVIILQIKSADLYFLKYTGKQDLYLNSTSLYNNRIYLFAPGSTVKMPKGKPLYYSDIMAKYMSDTQVSRLSFEVNNIEYRFKTGDIGIRNISFAVNHGKLVGIMGASGSGKTTLVNCLSGITSPSSGNVIINGINLHKEPEKLEGTIGYIPQDDLLIEELTVFQNLYYNAKLCFKDHSEDELVKLVVKTLKDLGLYEKSDLKVGNPMNKTISGGQRKRLNIALELIREPSILFVDEPTSGLSSRDSQNVMELLSELTQKGKLIFVVIHQPSSDIYKMFDRMIILDTGGYMIYYGNPVEAVIHFKTVDNQINSGVGECSLCGNVTPEIIFDIVEAQVVDEFGQYTEQRKIKPPQWERHFRDKVEVEDVEVVSEDPPATLNIPTWFKQYSIFTIRDVLSKVSNKQYIMLNLLEAPLLGFILAYLIRYIADPASKIYIFYDNENIPPYIFMSIVVALFLGMTVSAEEIFRDRKILKREKFLNLSRSAYLVSKISILTVISAIQAILFVVIGNSILGIRDMYFEYWIVLFFVFVFANMMGLNISATFNSAVTIYILIPLLLIPQMSLGGAMFSFDKLNRTIGSVDKVPLIADFMVSRWAYEGLMVYQFKENKFEATYFDVDQLKSNAAFKQNSYLPKLLTSFDLVDLTYDETLEKGANIDSLNQIIEGEFIMLRHELKKENREIQKMQVLLKQRKYIVSIPNEDKLTIDDALFEDLQIGEYKPEYAGETFREHISTWSLFYGGIYGEANDRKERIKDYQNSQSKGYYVRMRNKYHNEHLDDIVRNVYEHDKILRFKEKIVRQEDPIYMEPDDSNFIGIRSHFYAPHKYFMGNYYSTFKFNLIIILLMTILLYPPLYYEHFKRGLAYLGDLKLFKRKQKKEAENTKEKKPTSKKERKILKRISLKRKNNQKKP